MTVSKSDCDPFEYLPQFSKLLPRPGALLVSGDANDKPNVMTIGWAHIGILWSRPVCIVYVRPSRYSYSCLEQLHQFTVNVATAELAKAVSLCGTVSGRDQDKFQAAQLTPAPARAVKSPVIEQCILHYECNIAHHNDLIPENLDPQVINSCYAQGDFHRCYFGEIVACYGDRSALQKI